MKTLFKRAIGPTRIHTRVSREEVCLLRSACWHVLEFIFIAKRCGVALQSHAICVKKKFIPLLLL